MRVFFLCIFLSGMAVAQKNDVLAESESISKKSEDDLWLFAEGLYTRTWYKDAIAEYESFLLKFPSSSLAQNARWRIYECYGFLKNKASEETALIDYIKHEKNPVHREQARMNQARLLFEGGKFKDALTIYAGINKKLAKGALWENASYESARIYLQLAKPGEAFLRFRQLASLPYKGKNATRAYAIFAYASLLVDREKLKEAIEQYRRLTEHKETDPQIAENSWFNQASLFVKLEQKDKAKEAFEYIVKNFPNGLYKEQAINQLARCELDLANPVAALQTLESNNETSGTVKLETLYLSGFAYQQLKKYDEALKYYNECLQSKEELYKEECWYNKLNCLSAVGDSKRSLAHAKLMIKLYPQSIYLADVCYIAGLESEKLKDYDSSVAYFKKSLTVFVGKWSYLDSTYFALARVYRSQKKFAEEAAIWEELSLRSNSEYRSTAFVKGAEVWVEAGKPEKALTLLQNFLEVFPNDKDAFFVKSRIVEILLFSKKEAEAVKFLLKILSTEVPEQERVSLQSVLGRVYYYQGKFDLAVKVLNDCLGTEELSPEVKSDCLVFLGFSKISLEQEDSGVKHLAEVFEKREDFSGLLSTSEEAGVAALLEKYNYSSAAAKAYERLVLAPDKNNKLAGLLGQSRMAILAGKSDQGLTSLKKVLELCSEENESERVAALSLMGEVYFAKKKYDQAYQTFEFAINIKAGNEESACRILYGMAKILKLRKDYDQARRFANKVFILYKDPVYAPRAMHLSIESSILSNRRKEALETAVELKKNFPLYFAKIEVQDYLKEHGINPN